MIELTFNSAIAKILERKKLNTSSPIIPGEIYTLSKYHNARQVSGPGMEDFSSTGNILPEMYSPSGEDIISEEDAKSISLLNNITENDFLRVWVDKNDENDLCGLYFICNTLRNKQTPIIAAYIPEYTDNDFSLLNVDYIPVDIERKMAYAFLFSLLKSHAPEE